MTKRNKIPLKPKQLKAVEILVNPEFSGNISELCRQIDVARTTFYAWMDMREFREYLDRQIERYSDGETARVWKALIRQSIGGDTQAIKLFFELKGRYSQSVTVANTPPVQIINNIPRGGGDG